jgi:hypothetical protein
MNFTTSSTTGHSMQLPKKMSPHYQISPNALKTSKEWSSSASSTSDGDTTIFEFTMVTNGKEPSKPEEGSSNQKSCFSACVTPQPPFNDL